MCHREKEKKAEELQKEEAEAMLQRAKLEDLLMERRFAEERRKKAELGYAEISVIDLSLHFPYFRLCNLAIS
jgi:uncharacterized FAD-dependent dehydrogenase